MVSSRLFLIASAGQTLVVPSYCHGQSHSSHHLCSMDLEKPYLQISPYSALQQDNPVTRLLWSEHPRFCSLSPSADVSPWEQQDLPALRGSPVPQALAHSVHPAAGGWQGRMSVLLSFLTAAPAVTALPREDGCAGKPPLRVEAANK